MHRLKIIRDGGAIDIIMLPTVPRSGEWIIYDSDSGITWLAKVLAVAHWHPDPYGQYEAIVRVSHAQTFRSANEAEKAWLDPIEQTQQRKRLIPEFQLRNTNPPSPITPIDKFLNMRIDGDEDEND